ncbi:MAG: thioredoxin family protein [Bacteroidales bacterium]
MFEAISTLADFEYVAKNEKAAVFYFSHQECNVCKVLKPKLAELLFNKYKSIKPFYVDTIENQEIAAQLRIFSVPVILFYFEGKEYIRKSRNFSLTELESELDRPYNMVFEL